MKSFDYIIKSFRYAIQGLVSAFQYEVKIKIHCAAALVVIMIAAILGFSSTEWIIVFLCIGFVMALELINTSIELLADAITTETHPQIKKIKDIAAAAVLVSAIISVIVWVILLIPYITAYFIN